MKKFFLCIFSLILVMLMTVQVFAMQIFVRTPEGQMITLELEESDTIEIIKAMIQEKIGIKPENQRLYFGDVFLEDTKKLSDYNIKKEAMIILIAYEKTLNEQGNCSITIGGKYKKSRGGEKKISVDIEWESMSFTYYDVDKKIWNPEIHDYDEQPRGWSANQKIITVTNHSNIQIRADFSFNGSTGIIGSFSEESLTLESADDKKYNTPDAQGKYAAPKSKTCFKIDSESEAIAHDMPLGIISVNIVDVGDISSN